MEKREFSFLKTTEEIKEKKIINTIPQRAFKYLLDNLADETLRDKSFLLREDFNVDGKYNNEIANVDRFNEKFNAKLKKILFETI